MQVKDPSSASPPRAKSADELSAAEVRRPTDGGRGKSRFRGVLGSLDEGTTVGVGGDLTAAAFLGASFRVDGPRRPAVEAPAAGAPTAVDRVLIGTRDELAEARIRIGSGPLAGTELSVSAAPGGRLVEAALLTYAAGSRQTLSVVMEEIRLRLRGKGIVLASAERPRQGPRGRDPESSR